MRRDQLALAIAEATAITRQASVIVIGSQSILGSWSERDLPASVTLSNEVDIVPLSDDDRNSLEFALNARIGEDSEFHDQHDFYVEGVGRDTATLPRGWDERLVEFPGIVGSGATGLCLDPHDLCIAKLVANRDKDRSFLGALVRAGLISPDVLFDRLALTELDGPHMAIAQNFIGYLAEIAPAINAAEAPHAAAASVAPYVWNGKPVRGYQKPDRS